MTKRGNTKRTKSARRDRSRRRRSIGSRKYRGGAPVDIMKESVIADLYISYNDNATFITNIKEKATQLTAEYTAATNSAKGDEVKIPPEKLNEYNSTIKNLNIQTVGVLCLLKYHLVEEGEKENQKAPIQALFVSIVEKIESDQLDTTGTSFESILTPFEGDGGTTLLNTEGISKIKAYVEGVFQILSPAPASNTGSVGAAGGGGGGNPGAAEEAADGGGNSTTPAGAKQPSNNPNRRE